VALNDRQPAAIKLHGAVGNEPGSAALAAAPGFYLKGGGECARSAEQNTPSM
jgi:hypothetical protein